jgi:hypothetical protein
MSSGDSLFQCLPPAGEPVDADFATIDRRNGHFVYDFDPTTVQEIRFKTFLARNYGGGGISVRAICAASTASSNGAVLEFSFERIQDNAGDLDADSFGTIKTVTFTAVATVGRPRYVEVSFSNAEIDGLLAGEGSRLKVRRLTADAGDTMAGDLELWGLEARET